MLKYKFQSLIEDVARSRAKVTRDWRSLLSSTKSVGCRLRLKRDTLHPLDSLFFTTTPTNLKRSHDGSSSCELQRSALSCCLLWCFYVQAGHVCTSGPICYIRHYLIYSLTEGSRSCNHISVSVIGIRRHSGSVGMGSTLHCLFPLLGQGSRRITLGLNPNFPAGFGDLDAALSELQSAAVRANADPCYTRLAYALGKQEPPFTW